MSLLKVNKTYYSTAVITLPQNGHDPLNIRYLYTTVFGDMVNFAEELLTLSSSKWGLSGLKRAFNNLLVENETLWLHKQKYFAGK